MGAAMHLNFSQCTNSSQQTQGASSSQRLSCALSGCRLGTPAPLSLQLSEEDPLRDATNMMEAPPLPCPQMYSQQNASQQLLSTQDFCTPVDPPMSQQPWQALRTPAVISPPAKRSRSIAEMDADCDISMSQSQIQQGFSRGAMGPPGAAALPPTARKPLRIARPVSPVCLRNVFMGDAQKEDDDYNRSMCSLPRGAAQPTSRYRADFKEIEALGHGSFSRVLRAKHRLDGMEYALKRSLQAITDNSKKRVWIQAWARLTGHPNVVRYYGAWIEPHDRGEHMYIQLEKCGPSLTQRSQLDGDFLEPELVEILRQTALALQHVHSHGMVHMDVKPDNIYCCDCDADGGGGLPGGDNGRGDTVYKLGDFGTATQAKADEVCVDEGDRRYLAKEVLNDDIRHLEKADMFALGATLYELASGKELPSEGERYQELRQGKLALLPGRNQRFQQMIRQLMHPDAAQRPSPAKVLASQLVQNRLNGAAGAKAAGGGSRGGLSFEPTRH